MEPRDATAREGPHWPASPLEARRSEARYRALIAATGEAVWSWDVAADRGDLNQIQEWWQSLTGQSVDDQQAGGWLDRVHPDDRGTAASVWPSAIDRGASFEAEYRVFARDGSERVVLSRGAPVRDEAGTIVEWVGKLSDVTGQRNGDRAVRETIERLHLAMAAAKLGDWTWDAASDIVSLSNRAAEILHYPLGTKITWSELKAHLRAEDRETARAAVDRALAQRTDFEVHYQVFRPDGTMGWVSSRGHAQYNEAGQVVGMRGMVQDVTSRKQVEEALREADRRKDEFLAILAHELRNPLAPIRNAVEVLKLVGPRDPVVMQARDMVERQAGYMARLVDDLLDVSRISRGKVLLRREPVDLVSLVRSVVGDQRVVLQGMGLRVVADLPSRPLTVSGDPTRLAQIVINLLQNAGKFTDAGGLISVRLLSDGGNRSAVLTVKDTGVGLDPDSLQRLFEPFRQADRSVDRSRGGLGLGLAVVKGLVELHGGTIEASSPGPGQGSEFTVRLPLVADPQGPAVEGPAPAAPRRKIRVLVIEDNRDAAESLRMLLQISGHDVRLAFTGLAGIEAAREFRPHVILCDIGLPGGMDGYAVARALRSDRELFETALIALTGYGQDEDQQKARQAGFDRHLTKPVDPATLTRILESSSIRQGGWPA